MESVLSRWGDSLEMSRADEMGRRGQRWRTWVKQVLPGPELWSFRWSSEFVTRSTCTCMSPQGIHPHQGLACAKYGPKIKAIRRCEGECGLRTDLNYDQTSNSSVGYPDGLEPVKKEMLRWLSPPKEYEILVFS